MKGLRAREPKRKTRSAAGILGEPMTKTRSEAEAMTKTRRWDPKND